LGLLIHPFQRYTIATLKSAFVVDNGSVAARMIIDYGDLSEKIRAGNKDE